MYSENITFTNFENSEIAFRGQSNNSLRQSCLLFKVMNNRTLVKTGKYLVNFAFAIHFPVEGILRKTIYKHFVGGTSIDDCVKTIEKLASRNVVLFWISLLKERSVKICLMPPVMKSSVQLRLRTRTVMCRLVLSRLPG